MSITQKAIKDVALIAICSAILFVQQLALSVLPNIQFSTLLVVLYAKVLGFRRTSLIITIHVITYNVLSPFGSVIPTYLPFMYAAWMLIPIFLSTVFKKVDSAFGLAVIGFFFGFVYGWMFIPAAVFLTDAPFLAYLVMDIPFEIMMALSNFITIYWLFEPLKKVLSEQLARYEHKQKNGDSI
ncbi:MAG: hypothetical protein A2Y45_09115 [Tenericutes bacterium GWC2_34_14]|nr:MAG: hypothetical protein A2Z84_02975 [Tenericutes bacterium GWA2_35_7]OHE30045.1 MAG: hypothetical protein A2Y45_09115 [Tenericutes bacterium GWC2_34_14]OHE35024.1 MAG: hypothetical protein A2012_02725 [Tenericutes bacterium GWE2_34_108]OHE37116.1 MAG: hypothetical protein A2Y46_00285 [Tenericutes bacterium GWF1_35_14]OHE39752.1 MAG: hypothetical protein A2Y44_02575 [Tenericutes bacterium GWF2_35_184]OHE43994.1 MAG: hypothetical protein A3K26_07275 [Tenericutes bacterium RIFOXYA12_FULL_35_